MTNALELKNVSKHYPTFDLKNVTLALPAGCIMGLIGENGAGKSTLIKSVLDLVHCEGEIDILGRPHNEISDIKENIGVVLEESVFPDMLCARDVNAILGGIYKTWNRDDFYGYLRRFGLDEKKKVKDYSRGMKMKLSLAAALSHESKLLILDEATSGLDPVVREEVLDLFLGFIQDPSHSVLLSSHIISDLERICDYVTFIHKGQVHFSLTREELAETYGILRCSEQELAALPKSAVCGMRRNQFGVEALVLRRQASGVQLEPAGMEEIMVLLVKGVAK